MEELQKGRYRHFKGREYEVLHVATHSETMDKMVVYRQLYGDFAIWVRPLQMFTETVQWQDQAVQRFCFIGD